MLGTRRSALGARHLALTAILAVAMLIPSLASAQRRRGLEDVTRSDRHGFWLSIGAGAGWESYRFDTPSDWTDSQMAPSLWLALGGTVNQHLRLGAELNAWVHENFDEESGLNVTESLGGALLVAQFYPMSRQGLFFKGGLGISRSAADVEGPGGNVGETGFAALGGAGYEIRLGRNVFLTPSLNFMHHWSGDRDAPEGQLRERVLTVGVAFTFQPGR
ncbi:MAG: outer membrane beta-barrel protein [Gemmatimonadales bacterium]